MNILNLINFVADLTRLRLWIGNISRYVEVRRWRRNMLRDLNRRRRC